MSRKKRKWYPGAIYHVMSRGNRKDIIFKDEGDCAFFLQQLMKVKNQYSFHVHAICLMTNHFHIEIETDDVEIGVIMHKLLNNYVKFFNCRHSYKGHLFEGRFTSSLIESEAYFLEVSRYIHLNPVKAGMVRDPSEYRYGSYELYVSDPEEDEDDQIKSILSELTCTDRVLSSFGNDRRRYRLFVEGDASHEELELQIRKEMAEDEMWLPN